MISFQLGGEKMNKLLEFTLNTLVDFIKSVAKLSANSLSMIGMYEFECPEELIK